MVMLSGLEAILSLEDLEGVLTVIQLKEEELIYAHN
jgi:hypothetical protein